MDGRHFDRATRRLALIQLSRRNAVRMGGLSLAATALASLGLYSDGRRAAGKALIQDATPAPAGTPANPNDANIDGMWFCNQTFALCTTAPCELSQTDSTIANCHCVVENGPSIGNTSCAERAPSGKKLVSNFSTINVNNAFFNMTCPEDAPWANCLDVACEIDSYNPAQAVCQCVMVGTGPSLTFGGGCDASTCTSTIWSAAPLGFLGLSQFETGMEQIGMTVVLPPACPSRALAKPLVNDQPGVGRAFVSLLGRVRAIDQR